METKDIIHLYYGQRCRALNGYIFLTIGGEVTIKKGGEYLIQADIIKYVKHGNLQVELLLRPLSEMTEEEAVERENERLLDAEHWLPVSNEGHRYIHDNPEESYLKGWMVKRNA